MSDRANRTSSIPSVDIYVVCFPNLHDMFCHLLRNMSVKKFHVNRALSLNPHCVDWSFGTTPDPYRNFSTLPS